LSKEANVLAVASARSLLDNAARVRSTAMEDAYECLLAKQSDGKIAAAARDECLCFMAASEGWLSQANHLLHNGMTTGQYLELKGAISIVEKERGGLTMTAGYGNLSEVCAAQQRARNTRLNEVSALTNLATTTAGDGCNGGDGGGSEATAAIVPTAGGVGRDRGRIQRAKRSDGVEVVKMPVNWPFGTPERAKHMVSRVRTRSRMRMGDMTITKSECTKARMVRTGLATDDAVYVSIVKDMMPGMPVSQDVLNVCLT
jgi:hypothetical protein